MNVPLTEQQQCALDQGGQFQTRLVDPRTNVTYVLVPSSDFDSYCEIMADEREQVAIRAVGLRNAAKRLIEEL